MFPDTGNPSSQSTGLKGSKPRRSTCLRKPSQQGLGSGFEQGPSQVPPTVPCHCAVWMAALMCHIITRASGLLLKALPNCLGRSQAASFQNLLVHPHPPASRPGFSRERHRQVDGAQGGPSLHRCECLDSPWAVCFLGCLGTALATPTAAGLGVLFSPGSVQCCL